MPSSEVVTVALGVTTPAVEIDIWFGVVVDELQVTTDCVDEGW
jgi:hypothetical protein